MQIRVRQAAKRCLKIYLELKHREKDSDGEDQTYSGRSKRGRRRFHVKRYEEEQIPDDAIESIGQWHEQQDQILITDNAEYHRIKKRVQHY
jgi:hypothetical protein